MRTGSEYLRSLNDGRRVFVDGERVKDVTSHPAFRQAARSVANLFDIAADPALPVGTKVVTDENETDKDKDKKKKGS